MNRRSIRRRVRGTITDEGRNRGRSDDYDGANKADGGWQQAEDGHVEGQRPEHGSVLERRQRRGRGMR